MKHSRAEVKKITGDKSEALEASLALVSNRVANVERLHKMVCCVMFVKL